MSRAPGVEQLHGELMSAARAVLAGMRETPGGDAFEYQGGMNPVEWLRETVVALEARHILGGSAAP